MKLNMKFKKYSLIFILFLCISTFVCISTKKVYASTQNLYTDNENKDGLGYSINVATSKYLDVAGIRTGSPIFDEEWHNQMLNRAIKTNVRSSNTYSNSSNSIEEISADILADMNVSNSTTASKGIFSANIKNGFSVSTKMNYKETQSHYFYNLKADFVDYVYNLPNYSSNLSDYIDNLHPDYVQAIADLFSGKITYKQFFNIYGTHVLAKTKYGGSLDLYYSVTSNSLDVGGELKTKIDSALDAGIQKKIGVNNNFSFNLETALERNTSKCNTQFRIYAVGGNFFSATSLENFQDNYQSWYSTIYSRPALIGTTSDGLIPLWELIPKTYTMNHKLIIYNYFRSYVNENGLNCNDYQSNRISENSYSVTMNVRASERTITDEGRFQHNIYDKIDLDIDLEYGIGVLAQNGFKNVTITYSAEMREINHGYQYLFLYKSLEDNNNHLLYTKQFELNGNKLQKNYTNESFTFSDIPIREFLDTHLLVFRYGASGSANDDWQNKNVKITLTFNK